MSKYNHCVICGKSLVAFFVDKGYDQETGKKVYEERIACPIYLRGKAASVGFWGLFTGIDYIYHTDVPVLFNRGI